jgi:hypothetical protein
LHIFKLKVVDVQKESGTNRKRVQHQQKVCKTSETPETYLKKKHIQLIIPRPKNGTLPEVKRGLVNYTIM